MGLGSTLRNDQQQKKQASQKRGCPRSLWDVLAGVHSLKIRKKCQEVSLQGQKVLGWRHQPKEGSMVWNTAWTSSSPSKFSTKASTSSACVAPKAVVVVGTRSKPDSTISMPSASSLD